MKHYNEYVDSRGWHYRAMPLIGGQPYALCYQRTPGGGWHRDETDDVAHDIGRSQTRS